MANYTVGAGEGRLVAQILGHDRIRKKIGAGGTREACHIHNQPLARELAVAALSPRVLSDPSSNRHIHEKSLIASRFNHVNIVAVHDFDAQQAAFGRRSLLRGRSGAWSEPGNDSMRQMRRSE